MSPELSLTVVAVAVFSSSSGLFAVLAAIYIILGSPFILISIYYTHTFRQNKAKSKIEFNLMYVQIVRVVLTFVPCFFFLHFVYSVVILLL